jgi:hypothetical protein
MKLIMLASAFLFLKDTAALPASTDIGLRTTQDIPEPSLPAGCGEVMEIFPIQVAMEKLLITICLRM